MVNTHPTAKLLEGLITEYNTIWVEYVCRERRVRYMGTSDWYLKKYYNMKPCCEILSFVEYWQDEHGLEFYPEPDYNKKQ
jgi:hypothetical protein